MQVIVINEKLAKEQLKDCPKELKEYVAALDGLK